MIIITNFKTNLDIIKIYCIINIFLVKLTLTEMINQHMEKKSREVKLASHNFYKVDLYNYN